MTAFRIDHVVILVDDLAAATADYTALGFTVVEGGAHAEGLSRNALIAFADDTYIELIAFADPAAARESPALTEINRRFLARGAGGEGLVDYALLPQDIAASLDAARARGVAFSGPSPGGRQRPDGQEVRWMVGAPETTDLPFLCADVTPRTLRVPDGPARAHPNGVIGVAGLTIALSDLDASVERYRALLGAEAASGERGPVFALDGATITLVGSHDEAARARLAARGDGPCALTLRAEASSRQGALNAALTHGAQIAVAPA